MAINFNSELIHVVHLVKNSVCDTTDLIHEKTSTN